jgi:hypothetical protein
MPRMTPRTIPRTITRSAEIVPATLPLANYNLDALDITLNVAINLQRPLGDYLQALADDREVVAQR